MGLGGFQVCRITPHMVLPDYRKLPSDTMLYRLTINLESSQVQWVEAGYYHTSSVTHVDSATKQRWESTKVKTILISHNFT